MNKSKRITAAVVSDQISTFIAPLMVLVLLLFMDLSGADTRLMLLQRDHIKGHYYNLPVVKISYPTYQAFSSPAGMFSVRLDQVDKGYIEVTINQELEGCNLNYHIKNQSYVTYTPCEVGKSMLIPIQIQEEGIHYIDLWSILDDTYVELMDSISFSDTVESEIKDSMYVFLHPNYFVPYTEGDKIKTLGDRFVGQNDLETLQSVTAYLDETIDFYTTNLFPDVVSAEDVLAERQAVCRGHSILLTAVLREQGIPAKHIIGQIMVNGKQYGHSWNEVMIDGQWLLIDLTNYGYRLGAVVPEEHISDYLPENYY